MNCMYCGGPVEGTTICPHCGSDITLQANILRISDNFYNRGLEKAQIRDLTGAIDFLKRSLRYNKRNISARNLLGLVYFEVGEVVAALSEWVISQNMMPENNIASEFIEKARSNQAWLSSMQQTIRRYNRALDVSLSGEDDIAIVMLRKVLAANTNFIKAYHLLAFLYMKHGEYEKARRILKKAIPVDKTNATTLRFLKEIDEQTGQATGLDEEGNITDGRKSGLPSLFGKPKKAKRRKSSMIYTDEEEPGVVEESSGTASAYARAQQPAMYRRLTTLEAFGNFVAGIILGVIVIAFLVVPSVSQDANREAESKIAKYAADTAAKEDTIRVLEQDITESQETVASANAQIDEANRKAQTYEQLYKALNFYSSGEIDTAAGLLADIDPALLSIDATVVYNNIRTEINDQRFTQVLNTGIAAFEAGEYDTAISNLTEANTMKSDDYNTLSYLAHAYRLKGDTANAIATFTEIVHAFEGTHRAETAQHYIDLLRAGQEAPAQVP